MAAFEWLSLLVLDLATDGFADESPIANADSDFSVFESAQEDTLH